MTSWPNARLVVSLQITRAPETKHGFTGFFVPSHVIAAVFMYVVEAIGGFQGASETSEENEMWQEPPIKPDLSGRDSHFPASSPEVKTRHDPPPSTFPPVSSVSIIE